MKIEKLGSLAVAGLFTGMTALLFGIKSFDLVVITIGIGLAILSIAILVAIRTKNNGSRAQVHKVGARSGIPYAILWILGIGFLMTTENAPMFCLALTICIGFGARDALHEGYEKMRHIMKNN
ncbi:hypothetical protein COB55_01485 [Candidatus Wolfebacteria bacterium]|nr:MAG: hypothetical protein COB55_01485 [Candidatus Wolfebacteria bacterium]